MPLYEYLCGSCANRFELIRKFSDPPVTECPACGGPVEKLLSSPAIQFKGSGWYITDYAKSGAKEPPKTTPASSGETSSTPDGPATSTAAAKPKTGETAPAAAPSPAGKTDSK